MLREIKRIEEIQELYYGIRYCYYQDEFSIIQLDMSSFEVKKMNHKSNPFAIVGCNGDSILVRNQSRLTWYDHNLNETQSIEWIMKGRTQTKLLHEDFLIFRNSVNDTDWNLFGFDLSKNQINWTLSNDRSHFVQLDYPFFYQYNNKVPQTITCRSVLKGSEVWSYNLRDEEILSELVVGKGQLLIPTLSGKILSLDCRTGEQQWSIKAYPYPKLDELAKRFFTIQARFDYITFNMKDGIEVERVNNWANDDNFSNLLNTSGSGALLHKDSIVIPDIDQSEIFILEKKTARVIDNLRLNVSRTHKGSEVRILTFPVIKSERLFVLDSENELHVCDF